MQQARRRECCTPALLAHQAAGGTSGLMRRRCCAGHCAQPRRLSVVAAAARRDMSLVQRWRALQFGAKDLQRQVRAQVRWGGRSGVAAAAASPVSLAVTNEH